MNTVNTIYFFRRNNPDLFTYFYPSKYKNNEKTFGTGTSVTL